MNGHKTLLTDPVVSAPTVSADVIAPGDFLWADSGNSYAPRPFSAYTWDTNILTTQTSSKLVFLGVALSAKKAGVTDTVRIATDGVFEFDCASATFNLGDLVGAAKQTGNLMENQKVAAAVVAGAIGRVYEHVGTAATKVRVRIRSTLLRGAQT